QTEPYSVGDAQDVVDATNAFYLQNSFQQTSLKGDVAGWFTVPVSVTTCDYFSLGMYATQAAQAAGIDVFQYQRWVYAFPQNACPFLGIGTLGGTPSQAWINGPFQV